MNIEKGKRYRVITDDQNFFKSGEIVIALESTYIPWCIRESDYDERVPIVDYFDGLCGILYNYELEEIKGENYTETDSEDILISDIIKHQNEMLKYREIGTLEECMVAVEKQKAKKPYIQQDDKGNNRLECPICDSFIGYEVDCKDEHYQDNYCPSCGQKLDWESEGES